jgi:hypothetical protein
MTKAFLKMARAQATITALRQALDIVRRHDAKSAEQLILLQIAMKKPIIDDWKRQQTAKRNKHADDDYYKANAALMDD